MKITIYTPQAVNEVGGRQNNEDSIFPENGKAKIQDAVFLVCDGVGGAAKGEIASQIVAQTIGRHIQNLNQVSSPPIVMQAFDKAQAEIDKHISQNPESKGMATTLTFLHLHEAGATVAHCGDSRVYQFRKNQILFATDDHSYVNQLLKSGIITPEEAKNHSKKNVITRAMQGNSAKDEDAPKVKPDIHYIQNIEKGDIFLLCTDGVLERFEDEELTHLIAQKLPIENKMAQIKTECEGNTKDNFSAYLIEIKEVQGTISPAHQGLLKHNKQENAIQATVAEETNDTNERTKIDWQSKPFTQNKSGSEQKPPFKRTQTDAPQDKESQSIKDKVADAMKKFLKIGVPMLIIGLIIGIFIGAGNPKFFEGIANRLNQNDSTATVERESEIKTQKKQQNNGTATTIETKESTRSKETETATPKPDKSKIKSESKTQNGENETESTELDNQSDDK
ncbi:MAG: serine/threonine-protein phosphatase [Bernardetiaceae bacterium]|nr:serine/threonine-protein phosphatase [Bernardetiaceae bacterium]